MRSDQQFTPKRPARATIGLVAVAVVVALTAAACGSSSSKQTASTSTQATVVQTKAKPGGSLVVGVRAETNGWNPALDQWADTGSLEGSTVLEPLATTGTDSGAKPWLAKNWYPNTTFDKWVINLQSGVTFQDGEPFNADAVVLNINTYAKGPLSGLAIGPMFKTVKALTPTSVEVDLTQPWAAFPSSFLQGGSALMMAPAMINSSNGGINHPVGTGPFTFDSWTPGDTFTVKKNPTYWGGLDTSGKPRTGQGLPYLNEIQFKVIADDSTRTAALQNGDINMQYTTSAADATALASSYTELRDWDTEQSFIMPNTAPTVGGKANPLSNVHARMALAYATNAAQVAKEIGAGIQVPTSPWGPNNVWGMPSSQNGYVTYNLAQAKAQVAQYDSATGQTGLTFTLSGLPSVDDARTLQLLQGQWKQAGISVNIETLEQTAYITKIATGGYQAAFFRNYGYPDPDQDYYFWSSTTAKGVGNISINFTQYSTSQIEKDLTTGRQSGYAKIRKAAYDDLVKQLNAGFTNVWLYSTPYSFIAQKKVMGLNAPGGPSTIAFGNYSPKTWWPNVWLNS